MKKILFAICLLLVACSPIRHSRSIPDLDFGSGVNTGTGESLNSAMHKLQLLIDEANRLGFTEDLTTANERNLLHGVGNQKDIRTIVTMIYTAAGDTSSYPTPAKFGDFYFDSSAHKLYFAETAVRGGWLKLN